LTNATPPAVEAALLSIWRGLLGSDAITRDDNFFDLGGHSLLAAQVVARLEVSTGVALPVRYLFDRPSAAGLAAAIVQRQRPAAPDRDAGPLAGVLDAMSDPELDALLQQAVRPA
jgi:acyl carrier protein